MKLRKLRSIIVAFLLVFTLIGTAGAVEVLRMATTTSISTSVKVFFGACIRNMNRRPPSP